MSMMIAGIAGAGVSVLGSALASKSAAKSANKAADLNAKNIADTNAANLNMFNLSRGAKGEDGFGHSILPFYFGGNEEAMARQAYDNFARLSGMGNTSANAASAFQSSLRPSLDTSLSNLSNRFNGLDLAQRVNYSNPYFTSRLNQANVLGAGYRDIAGANSSAIDTGLAETLAQMNAGRASQGFLGNSTFDRNRALAATLAARQSAAVQSAQANAGANSAVADAQFNNAAELRAMQLADMDFASNPGALTAGLGAATEFENIPASVLANSFNTAMQPLSFFRIQPQAFQQQNLPTVSPQISNGQILGSLLQQGGSAFANYALSKNLLQNYGGGTSGANPYAVPSGQANNSLMSNYQFNPTMSGDFMTFRR